MFNYLVRRALYTIPLVFGVSLLVFVLFNVVGSDPTIQMLGKHATPQSIAELRHELGLDRPLLEQFVNQIWSQWTFNFGRSYATKQLISKMIGDGLVPSLCLTVPPFFLGEMLAISIALGVCYVRGSWIDRLTVVATVTGMSITPLAYILAGQYVLAYQMRLFPIQGFEYPTSWLDPGSVAYTAWFLGLPWIIWITTGLGADVRFYRTVILDEVAQDYVRTARAKGLSEPVIYFKHILKNAMIPIITSVVIALPFLYTGSLLLEAFFGIPGLGSMSINGINNSDFPVVKAMTFIGSVLYIVANLLSDICYALADPRVKLG